MYLSLGPHPHTLMVHILTLQDLLFKWGGPWSVPKRSVFALAWRIKTFQTNFLFYQSIYIFVQLLMQTCIYAGVLKKKCSMHIMLRILWLVGFHEDRWTPVSVTFLQHMFSSQHRWSWNQQIRQENEKNIMPRTCLRPHWIEDSLFLCLWRILHCNFETVLYHITTNTSVNLL